MDSHDKVFQSIEEVGGNYITESARVLAGERWLKERGAVIPTVEEAKRFISSMNENVTESIEEKNDTFISFSSLKNDNPENYKSEKKVEDYALTSDPLAYVADDLVIGDHLGDDVADIFSVTGTGTFNFRTPGKTLSDELSSSSPTTTTTSSRPESFSFTGRKTKVVGNPISGNHTKSKERKGSINKLSSKFDSLSIRSDVGAKKTPSMVDQFKTKAETYIRRSPTKYRNNLVFVIVPSESALQTFIPQIRKKGQTEGFLRAHIANHLAPAKNGQSGIGSTIFVTGNGRQFRLIQDPTDNDFYFFSKQTGKRKMSHTEKVQSIIGSPIRVKYCHLAGERDTLHI